MRTSFVTDVEQITATMNTSPFTLPKLTYRKKISHEREKHKKKKAPRQKSLCTQLFKEDRKREVYNTIHDEKRHKVVVEEEMEEAKGVVKHVLLAKFKDDVTPERIEELIKDYANLVNLIPPMKSFHWGKDVSAENLHQGFTHVFESTFESPEGVAEYVAHPAHVEYANLFLSCLEKVIVIDYKPTVVKL